MDMQPGMREMWESISAECGAGGSMTVDDFARVWHAARLGACNEILDAACALAPAPETRRRQRCGDGAAINERIGRITEQARREGFASAKVGLLEILRAVALGSRPGGADKPCAPADGQGGAAH